MLGLGKLQQRRILNQNSASFIFLMHMLLHLLLMGLSFPSWHVPLRCGHDSEPAKLVVGRLNSVFSRNALKNFSRSNFFRPIPHHFISDVIAVRADNFHRSQEICQFPCNFYSKFSFQLLKKVRFNANVITQLIVHVTPLVWRKMNFQLNFLF